MEWVLTGSVVLIAAAFRGITGFGYALIVAIGLSASFAPQTMVPLILVTDLLITAMILFDRKNGAIDWKVARVILAVGFIGSVCGGLLAGYLDEVTTKLLVAAAVCLSAVIAMAKDVPRWMSHRIIGVLAAFTVGVLLAAFAVGGPLIAVWLLAGGTKPEKTRGTLALFFGAVDIFGLAGRFYFGHIDPGLPSLLLTYVPITIAGYFIGQWLGRKLSPLWWRRTSAIGLVLIALISAGQTLHGLTVAAPSHPLDSQETSQ